MSSRMSKVRFLVQIIFQSLTFIHNFNPGIFNLGFSKGVFNTYTSRYLIKKKKGRGQSFRGKDNAINAY